jgi:DNA mismatch repair protein MutS2
MAGEGEVAAQRGSGGQATGEAPMEEDAGEHGLMGREDAVAAALRGSEGRLAGEGLTLESAGERAALVGEGGAVAARRGSSRGRGRSRRRQRVEESPASEEPVLELRPGEEAVLDALPRLDDEALEALRSHITGLAQQASRRAVQSVQQELGQARQQLERQRPRAAGPSPEGAGVVTVGQSVRVPGFTEVGQVLSLPDAKGQLEVQVGAFRVQTRAAEVLRAPRPRRHEPSYGFQRAPRSAVPPSLSRPVDLRGVRADEVELSLDRELNEAFGAGVQYVKIIHGHGSGIVRRIVREYLAQQPYVSGWEPAPASEGGDGATIVTLAV